MQRVTACLGRQSKEDVLQLNKEVVGVDCPLLPSTEAEHYLLLKKTRSKSKLEHCWQSGKIMTLLCSLECALYYYCHVGKYNLRCT